MAELKYECLYPPTWKWKLDTEIILKKNENLTFDRPFAAMWVNGLDLGIDIIADFVAPHKSNHS